MNERIGKIDLHMHTTKSDGTDSPVEIVDIVKKAGIDIFSITDHDAIEGCKSVRQDFACFDDAKTGCFKIKASLSSNMDNKKSDGYLIFINGVEFSTRDEKGKYHILGYAYDESAPEINGTVQKGHDIRMQKLTERLDFLKNTFDIDFTDEEKKSLYELSNPGKPHIGKLIVQHGFAKNVDGAITGYINKRKATDNYVRPEEAIDAILKSGGVPVLAHPSYGDGNQLIIGNDMEDRLKHLMAFGLEGVEAFYSEFNPKLSKEILDFADKYDLLVTAGSDYHGKNKMIEIGDTGLQGSHHQIKRLERFIDRIL